MVKVKALYTFAHSKSLSGLRQKEEVFECSIDEVEHLNAIHDFDLVKVLEDEKTEKEPKKEPKKRKKGASDSDSKAVSDQVDG